jgi:hypothetical protein
MLAGEGRWRDLEVLGMERVPLRALANPTLTALGGHTVMHREGCLSMPGFSAHVPRALSVQVDAHDIILNQRVQFRASGWHARILQHEVRVVVVRSRARSLSLFFAQPPSTRMHVFTICPVPG